jgi:general secretion pathway protein N
VKRGWLLVALGLGAYLVFVLATLPASLLASQVERHGLSTVATAGTVWDGRFVGLRAGSRVIGDVAWDLQPSALLLGRLAAHVDLVRSDGRATADVTAGLGGTVTLENATAALPFAALAELGAPRGWEGTLRADLERLVIDEGWIAAASGTLEARDVVGPARNPARLGSYRVTLPAGGTASGEAGESQGALVGALEDLGDGPLEVAGTIRLSPDRTYQIDGLVSARESAPRSVVDSLRFLGNPDTQGKRPFSIAGSL